MCLYMPYGNFRWASTDIAVTTIPDDSETGYILQVDLGYPKDLHDKHKYLPLLPDHIIPKGSKHSKLVTTLSDKDIRSAIQKFEIVLAAGNENKKNSQCVKF